MASSSCSLVLSEIYVLTDLPHFARVFFTLTRGFTYFFCVRKLWVLMGPIDSIGQGLAT